MTTMRFFRKLTLCAAALLPATFLLSCTDDELAVTNRPSQENTVTVSLPIELEDVSDAADAQPETRSMADDGSAFDVYLGAAARTRSGSYTDALKDAKPATLASVRILQLSLIHI